VIYKRTDFPAETLPRFVIETQWISAEECSRSFGLISHLPRSHSIYFRGRIPRSASHAAQVSVHRS
jgi:hypothetical protein